MKKSSITFQLSTGEDALPVKNATVTISDNNSNVLGTLNTDNSGKTTPFFVKAPSWTKSFEPYSQELPYAEYNAVIKAEGFIPIEVRGIQVYDGINSIVALELNPKGKEKIVPNQIIQIPKPAVLENEGGLVKEAIPRGRENPRYLQYVYIPNRIIVHLGRPSNTAAENVSVSFPDYIKNVASSEIYPTWPENAIRSNIYAQISFALNRIFTEWYTSRGYNFNITNSTAYDQAFVKGRNIFENISRIVDEIFNEFVRRKGAVNPLFTQYCNGTTVTCDGLSQWGTVPLAQQGFSPLQILKYFYGNDIEIVSTDRIEDIVSSYPGFLLRKGVVDPSVKTIKTELNRIRKNYPLIPEIKNMDNYFDDETEAAVKVFQRIFNLSADGIVGKATWNKLSYIYVAILKLAELNGEMITPPIPEETPYETIKLGSTGSNVKLAQYFLAVISKYYDTVPSVEINGVFDEKMRQAVMDFQNSFNLGVDGIIGPKTWEALYDTYLGIGKNTGLYVDYPGNLLKVGSRGDQVWLMQSYLQTISKHLDIPYINADGIYGQNTKNAVMAFQRLVGLSADGIIGPDTWDKIVAVRMLY